MITTKGKLLVAACFCFVYLQNKERGRNNVTKEELESCMINQVTWGFFYYTDVALAWVSKKRLGGRIGFPVSEVESQFCKLKKWGKTNCFQQKYQDLLVVFFCICPQNGSWEDLPFFMKYQERELDDGWAHKDY